MKNLAFAALLIAVNMHAGTRPVIRHRQNVPGRYMVTLADTVSAATYDASYVVLLLSTA